MTKTPTIDDSRSYLDFIHLLKFDELPEELIRKAELTLLDTCAVTAAGSRMRAAGLMKKFAIRNFAYNDIQPATKSECLGKSRLLFDGRFLSPGGAALAAGQAADSVDAHDGYYEVKGAHISATLLAGLLALGDAVVQKHDAGVQKHFDREKKDFSALLSGKEILTAWILAQELAIRFGCAVQSTLSEVYIPSGLLGAIGIAALGSRLLGLNSTQTRHALGIAELHAPRIQTNSGWRVTLHPTMLKDTIAWGAMAGVNAALLAMDGFSGAPCGILEDAGLQHHFAALGKAWKCLHLYMKPVPCCRYAIPAVRAILQLLDNERQRRFVESPGMKPEDVNEIQVTTFREAWLLGCDIGVPRTAEEAQYHVAWPVAAAAVQGALPGPRDFSDMVVEQDEAIRRMCAKITLSVNDQYTRQFPGRTLADIKIIYSDGREAVLAAEQVLNRRNVADSPDIDASESLILNASDPDLGICAEKDVLEKFERYTVWGVGRQRTNRLSKSILSLKSEKPGVVTEFFDSMLDSLPF
jgi:2-methylcitrate dehydratase PrpD